MPDQTYLFRDHTVQCRLDADFQAWLQELAEGEAVILCDYHLYQSYHHWFAPHPVIKVPAGEAHKTQSTADYIIAELMKLQAGKKTRLIAVGGALTSVVSFFALLMILVGIVSLFLRWRDRLYEAPLARKPGTPGRPRKRGARLSAGGKALHGLDFDHQALILVGREQVVRRRSRGLVAIIVCALARAVKLHAACVDRVAAAAASQPGQQE